MRLVGVGLVLRKLIVEINNNKKNGKILEPLNTRSLVV